MGKVRTMGWTSSFFVPTSVHDVIVA